MFDPPPFAPCCARPLTDDSFFVDSITLHNVSDPTDVFAKSEMFDVRPQGSE